MFGNNLMQNFSIRYKFFFAITLVFISACAHLPHDKHDAPVLPEFVFKPTTQLASQVAQTLLAAKTENKKALFVLGAQWCHDSKGLAKNFSTPQMQTILQENYHVLFVDAGYLENGFDLVKQFNLPIYYGTPTVMIVEPSSKEIINRASMRKWLSADKVPLNEYETYFSDYAANTDKTEKVSATMQHYLDTINQFEQQQADRLKAAYKVIGPLLAAYMQSENKKASDEFSHKWGQVADIRFRLQDDIQTLIAQAKNNVNNGVTTPLDMPKYEVFDWE